jgi:hypothetical protein
MAAEWDRLAGLMQPNERTAEDDAVLAKAGEIEKARKERRRR